MTTSQARTKHRTTAQIAELRLQYAEDYHQQDPLQDADRLLTWPKPYRVVPLPPEASLLVSCSHCARSANSSPVIWTPSGKSWRNRSAAGIGSVWRAGSLAGSAGMGACWGRSSAGRRAAGMRLAAARWPCDHW